MAAGEREREGGGARACDEEEAFSALKCAAALAQRLGVSVSAIASLCEGERLVRRGSAGRGERETEDGERVSGTG